MAHQVFISYASSDREQALRICAELESGNVPCWIAPRNVPPDTQNWAQEIADGLMAAALVLLVFSAHTNDSDEVATELALAREQRKRLLFVRLEDVAVGRRLMYYLAGKQRIDAPGGDVTRLQLARRVHDLMEGRASDFVIQQERAKSKWLSNVWWIGIAALTAIGALLVVVSRVYFSPDTRGPDGPTPATTAKGDGSLPPNPVPSPTISAPPAPTNEGVANPVPDAGSWKDPERRPKPDAGTAKPDAGKTPTSGDKELPAPRSIAAGSLFSTGKATLRPEGDLLLAQFADSLAGKDYGSVVVQVHSDNVGSSDANLQLSAARADAIRQYLVGRGISAGKIVASGMGATNPVADNATEEGRARNRRVVLSAKP
jgi:outer membrane protein OmpA-like peptidoglycan-associated protein